MKSADSSSDTMNSNDVEKYMRDVGLDTKWRANWWQQDFLELLGKRLSFERVEKCWMSVAGRAFGEYYFRAFYQWPL